MQQSDSESEDMAVVVGRGGAKRKAEEVEGDGESTIADEESTVGGDATGDEFVVDDERKALTKPLKECSRATILLITVHEGYYKRGQEPKIGNFIKNLKAAAWQEEVGKKGETPHIHVAAKFDTKKGLRIGTVQKAIKSIFPFSDVEKMDVRVPRPSVDFQAVGNYCTKPDNRPIGGRQELFNFERRVMTKRQIDSDEVRRAIQDQESYRDLAKGETRGLYQYRTETVVQCHAERRLKRSILSRGDKLYAWETALLDLMQRAPQSYAEGFVHWFCPRPQSVERAPSLTRFPRIIRKALGYRKQSRQTLYYESSHDQQALDNQLDARVRSIFVLNCDEKPISHNRLHFLRTKEYAHSSRGDRYDTQELGPRHVVVFSMEPPPDMQKATRCSLMTKVWYIDTDAETWTQREALLKHGIELEQGKTFLDFDTLGVSGVLYDDLEE
tara:strand:+ start:1263 stop:2588 length:1326 start_codon:yes stop_codon:yes gene_type:complete